MNRFSRSVFVTVFVAFSLPTYAGWIALDSEQAFSAASPVPGAFGTGVVQLNEDGTELSYDITVNGLSGPIAAAHFHGPAPEGVAAPVVRTLTFNGFRALGVWKNTDAQPLTRELANALRTGWIYVNVHTALNPSGEIRGQVHLGPSFNAGIDQAQTAPAAQLVLGAFGTGFALLSPTEDRVEFQLTVAGLSGAITASHFHGPADPGQPAGVAKTITFNGTHAEGVWTTSDATQPLTAEWVQALKDGKLYFNVHTALNPAGEIRGQIVKVEPTSHARGWAAYK